MMTAYILDDLPLRMVRDLKNAFTAERAEKVFHAWRDKGLFVPAHCRARVWADAITHIKHCGA